jgi:hypothetical protein
VHPQQGVARRGHDGGQAGETLHGCHAADFDAPASGLFHAGEKSTRSSPVVSDGAYFYWAQHNGGQGCPGVFKRRPIDGSAEETLATNLDRVVRIRSRNGTYFLGTTTTAPLTSKGQLLAWTP